MSYKSDKYVIKETAGSVKSGMVFKWDKEEDCFTTKELPWMLTPLISREEMAERVKIGQFERIDNAKH